MGLNLLRSGPLEDESSSYDDKLTKREGGIKTKDSHVWRGGTKAKAGKRASSRTKREEAKGNGGEN